MLESEIVQCVDKKITIDMKSNTQGKFVKLTEVMFHQIVTVLDCHVCEHVCRLKLVSLSSVGTSYFPLRHVQHCELN